MMSSIMEERFELPWMPSMNWEGPNAFNWRFLSTGDTANCPSMLILLANRFQPKPTSESLFDWEVTRALGKFGWLNPHPQVPDRPSLIHLP